MHFTFENPTQMWVKLSKLLFISVYRTKKDRKKAHPIDLYYTIKLGIYQI